MDLRQLPRSNQGLEGLSLAGDEEDVGRFEPASDKAQDGGGRTVKPLKVVRNHDQGPFVGDLVHEAKGGQADKKHLGRGTGAHSQCGEQRVLLRAGKCAGRRQNGLQKLVQPRECKISLAFKACDREHLVTAAAGVAGYDVQKGRLADAGRSGDEQSAAVLRRLGKSSVELRQLSIPAHQSRRSHPGLILPLAHS
jgi:hypothetical protein